MSKKQRIEPTKDLLEYVQSFHPQVWEKIKSRNLEDSLTVIGEYFGRPVGHLVYSNQVQPFKIIGILDKAIANYDHGNIPWLLGETAAGAFELHFAGDGCYDVLFYRKSFGQHITIGTISKIEGNYVASRFVNNKLKSIKTKQMHTAITYLQNLSIKYDECD